MLGIDSLIDDVERHTDAALLCGSSSVEDERFVGWQLTITCGRLGIRKGKGPGGVTGVVLGSRPYIVEDGLATIEQSPGFRWRDAPHILFSKGCGRCRRRD